jgi:hypothetical protein
MTVEKIKKINEFGFLIYDVLWTEKSKNKKVLKKLKDLINSKTKLDFKKEDFINLFFFDDCLFPFKPREEYNNLDDFILTFFEDSYDAVVMENDFTVMILLEERIADFNLLLDNTYGVDNAVSYNK